MAEGSNDGRSCGDCAACCKTHGVAELNKPEGEWCIHCKGNRSCGIYPTRPPSCKSFRCAWLNGSGAVDERPDKTRIVCTTETVRYKGREVNWCTMMEVSVGAFQRPYTFARTAQLRAHGWVVEQFALGMARITIILPKGLEKDDLPFLMLKLKKAEIAELKAAD